MALIDQIFLTVFARYRRKLGESSVNSAWIRAVGKVSGFLIWPVAAVTCVLVISMYLLTGSGTPADHMRWGKVTTVVSWLAMAFLLQARFTKYLHDPPVLSPAESAGERYTVMWFHLTCIGVFVVLCAAGFALHAAGLGTRLGF